MAQTLLIRDGETVALGSKEVCTLRAGDVLSFRLSGAGGYGDPAVRDPEKVREDVRQGFVTAAAAAGIHGRTDPSRRHRSAPTAIVPDRILCRWTGRCGRRGSRHSKA